MKKLFKMLGIILIVIAVIVGGYVAYVFFSFERESDNKVVEIKGWTKGQTLKTETSYEIATYNLGYGAYSQDYTFFMDGGKESKAYNREEVLKNIEGSTEVIQQLDPDIILFQEVDIKATRSYNVNQEELIKDKFKGYVMGAAENYNSEFLMYPIFDPFGRANSEILTLSKVEMKEGIRRSLPISTGLSKFLDLDRCYMKTAIDVDEGKKLYVYNVHLSAYGIDETVRNGQMQMLFDDMNEKAKAGNYVICGGDFNHDFTGDSLAKFNGENEKAGEWAQPFPEKYLGDTFTRVTSYTDQELTPSARNNDIPYDKEKSRVLILDGFIISNNVKVEAAQNHNTEFMYTDHMPVIMKFILEKQNLKTI